MRRRAEQRGRRPFRVAASGLILSLAVVLTLALAAGAWPARALSPTDLALGASAGTEHFLVLSEEQRPADQTALMAERAWTRLASLFKRTPPSLITISVVEDGKTYEEIEPAPMTKAFATFGGNQIFVRGDQLDQQVVTHELTHIFLGYNVTPGLDVPDWFNEGLAQYTSGGDSPTLELMYDLSSGKLLTLPELSAIDALHSPDRSLATIEGLAVVDFLVSDFGEAKLWAFVARLQDAPSFNQALIGTYGHTDLQLNDRWMAYARHNFGLFSPMILRLLLFVSLGLLAFLAAVVWWIRRVRMLRPARDGDNLTTEEIARAEQTELQSFERRE